MNWPDIIEGKVLLETPLGTEYEVSEIGHIWVSRTDYEEAIARGAKVVCDLVSDPDDDSSKALWAIVRLQNPAPDTLT